MRNSDENEDLAVRLEQELRNGRRLLWVALAAAVLALLPSFGNGIWLFALGWIVSFLGGIAGISQVARALNANVLVKYLSMLVVFMPGISILPLAYYLVRAQSALGQLGEASVARLREQPRARQPDAPRVAGAVTRAAPAKQPTPTRPQAAPRAASVAPQIAGAIACVKYVGLRRPAGEGGEPAEGARLHVKISRPGMDLPEKDEPVMRATQALFAVGYLVDKGEFYSNVNIGELESAGITLDELHRIGMRNLAALVNGKPGLSLRPQGSFHGLILGGNFEASLVLLDELWDGPLREHAPNGPVATVPARDICAFCDARSAEGIAALRGIAARVTKTGDHLLSEMLLARKDGRWREFDAPKPADLPPLEFKL